MKRQRIRTLILLISLLVFPVTMWYFSPAIIIMGMIQHILNGSFFVFLLMLILSMFMSRLFCGYLCPVGALQECMGQINSTAAKQGKRKWIKFVIWVVWLSVVVISYLLGKGKMEADFFFMTDHGVSVSEVGDYITYYGVILFLFLPPLIFGKRASCHYICWMAPFMIAGEKIGQKLHLPQLHITAEAEKCISCKKCESVCQMGLQVETLVKQQKEIKCIDCIQCGVCVDTCPNKVLHYSMKWR